METIDNLIVLHVPLVQLPEDVGSSLLGHSVLASFQFFIQGVVDHVPCWLSNNGVFSEAIIQDFSEAESACIPHILMTLGEELVLHVGHHSLHCLGD